MRRVVRHEDLWVFAAFVILGAMAGILYATLRG